MLNIARSLSARLRLPFAGPSGKHPSNSESDDERPRLDGSVVQPPMPVYQQLLGPLEAAYPKEQSSANQPDSARVAAAEGYANQQEGQSSLDGGIVNNLRPKPDGRQCRKRHQDKEPPGDDSPNRCSHRIKSTRRLTGGQWTFGQAKLALALRDRLWLGRNLMPL